MSENKLKARLQHAVKTEAEWKSVDPVLLKGEIAYSSDNKQWKTGDGTSKWSAIAYDKATPTGHTHRDVDASGCFAYYGSDTANSNGWYKVYSTTLTGYGDHVARLSLVSTYSDLFYGVINIDVRSDNKTTLTVRNLTWESRQGFEVGDVIIVTNGNIWTLYVRRNCSQYGRIKIRVLESSAISGAWNMVLTNNTTKETTAPTPTVTATDGATVKYANSAGSVEWNNVKNKPSTFTPASHTHDDRYYTESEMDSKLDAKLNKSGGDVTGIITATNSAAANIGFTAKNSETGKSVSLMVGSGKYNRGVYDHVSDKWMIYADQNNNVIVNGTASKANSVAWANVTDKILVSSNNDGLMRKEDKAKLDAFNAASTYASIDYVKTQISNSGYLKKVIVSTLPSSSDVQENLIYMIQKASAEKNNSYDEYMFVNGNLEKLGDNQVVLESLTNADIDEILGEKYSSSTSGLDNVVLG